MKKRAASVSTLTPTDAAYLAGLFDGEGCLTVTLAVSRRGAGKQGVLTPGVKFLIINTNENVLNWCHQTLAVGWVVTARKYAPGHPRRLPIYRYTLDTKLDLLELLPQLQPYLRIKEKQAALAIEFMKSRAPNPNGPYSEGEVDLLFDLRHSNLKDYDTKGTPTIRYKKVPYTREAFKELFFSRRDGSIYHSVNWTPEMDALVGTDVDRVIAHRLGLKIAQVQRRRTSLNIPPQGSVDPKRLEVKRLRSQGLTLKKISARVGISYSAIQRIVASMRPIESL